jgi:DNA-binding NarL/FixJ family response regulator
MIDSSEKIKVILTDDHKIIREGIKALLATEENVTVVGEAYDGDSLLDLLKEIDTDIVLLDINMEGRNGLEITAELKEQHPEVKVIILSMLDNEHYVSKAIENGASGYLVKTAGREEVSVALKLVNAGSTFISPSISLSLLNNKSESLGFNNTEQESLSKRELEVLHLIAEGYTNAEIAEKLFNSKRTIETHRQNMLEKTKCKNTASLIKYAVKKGLV